MLDALWGEVIATPGEHQPYRVIVEHKGRIIAKIDVPSREEGQRVLDKLLKALGE